MADESVSIQDLLDVLSEPAVVPTERARVAVSKEPIPFVAPRLKRVSGTGSGVFATDVIVISAPAAVGKSTLARYISAKSRAPILNLAETPVSTHSLVGILQADFVGPMDPLEAFAQGRVPIILDALDEGRLLTGEKGFEQFILTTAELVNRDRSTTNRPKLLLFGRSGSSADAAFIMSLMREGLIGEFRIDYFDHESARLIIEAYGDAQSGATGKLRRSEPAQRAVSAYFDAISRALSLSSENLWTDPIGRSFAGYAPVLATLGQALGHERNPYDLENRLIRTDASNSEAWIVIDQVIDQMLSRESDQLANKLRSRTNSDIPHVYGRSDQLTFLARWLSGESIRGIGEPIVSGDIADIYYQLIEQKLPEHPFLDAERRTPRNAVFGAAIFAHAITHGLTLGPNSTDFLVEAARQPFLWRFFSTAAGDSGDFLVDGRHLGYLLASLWTDPLEPSPSVTITDDAVGSVRIVINSRRATTINAVPPVVLYGSCQDAKINIGTELCLRGATVKAGGRSIFAFQGEHNALTSATLEIDADEMILESQTWISANSVLSAGRLKLQIKSEEFGWGGSLPTQYPWSSWQSTISDPNLEVIEDTLTNLVKAFLLHVGEPPKPFYVGWNHQPLNTDQDRTGRSAWMSRDFAKELPVFVRLLIRHNLAAQESVSGQGASRIRIRMKCSWNDLLVAVKSPVDATAPIAAFVRDFRVALPD